MATDHFADIRATCSKPWDTVKPGTPAPKKACPVLETEKANELKDFSTLGHRDTGDTEKWVEREAGSGASPTFFSLARPDGEAKAKTQEKKNGERECPSRATPLILGVPSVPVSHIDILYNNKGFCDPPSGTPLKMHGVPGVPPITPENSGITETPAERCARLDAERNERDRLAGRGYDYAPRSKASYVVHASPNTVHLRRIRLCPAAETNRRGTDGADDCSLSEQY
jgi:hypothetical protein